MSGRGKYVMASVNCLVSTSTVPSVCELCVCVLCVCVYVYFVCVCVCVYVYERERPCVVACVHFVFLIPSSIEEDGPSGRRQCVMRACVRASSYAPDVCDVCDVLCARV